MPSGIPILHRILSTQAAHRPRDRPLSSMQFMNRICLTPGHLISTTFRAVGFPTRLRCAMARSHDLFYPYLSVRQAPNKQYTLPGADSPHTETLRITQMIQRQASRAPLLRVCWPGHNTLLLRRRRTLTRCNELQDFPVHRRPLGVLDELHGGLVVPQGTEELVPVMHPYAEPDKEIRSSHSLSKGP
jgi:hypothetical protein